MKRLWTRLMSPRTERDAVAGRRGYCPRLEALESRWAPAVAVTNPGGNHIHIIGNAAADTVTVTQDDAADRITVAHDGVTNTFASSRNVAFLIVLGEGNDTLNFRLASDFTRAKSVSIYLDNQNGTGAGADTADL